MSTRRPDCRLGFAICLAKACMFRRSSPSGCARRNRAVPLFDIVAGILPRSACKLLAPNSEKRLVRRQSCGNVNGTLASCAELFGRRVFLIVAHRRDEGSGVLVSEACRMHEQFCVGVAGLRREANGYVEWTLLHNLHRLESAGG
jgi:hypothetical protein